MRIGKQFTDQAILSEIGERLARSRLSRNLTQAGLALEAGVSKRTIERMESGESVQLTSFVRILRSLGLAERLETLVPELEASPMQQLKRQGKERRRASSSKKSAQPASPWTWGE